MTTHVFIVDERTFNVHLEYMFVGTGSNNKDIDFNGVAESDLHHQTENGLVSMMSDFSRIRQGDFVIFYVQAENGNEGKFYGIYKITSEPFHEPNNPNQYLKSSLGKNLTFRALIEPHKVYAQGVTEWEALDEIKGICSPNQMLWSLIYRKLKGNRGNTMVTIYESERLFDLIRRKNGNKVLLSASYNYNNNQVCASGVSQNKYGGNTKLKFNILDRLIYKMRNNRAYEAHLQMYIVQNIGKNHSLDSALNIINKNLEWIGNEVSCGVGMQRIDIMLSIQIDNTERHIIPIELKAVPASPNNVNQLSRYIDWIEQYYVPNRPSIIRPVLICPKSTLSNDTINAFNSFNSNAKGRYFPLEYIEFTIKNNNLNFTKKQY